MEEVETDHAVILEYRHEAEDRRRKILSVPVHNRRKGKRNPQHADMEKDLEEKNQITDEDDITIKQPSINCCWRNLKLIAFQKRI